MEQDAAELWRAVLEKDVTLDGRFVYGVLTTGIFCRPGCPARTPKRANVRFYRDPVAAGQAGLRACLRCRPLEPLPEALHGNVEAICVYISGALEQPKTSKLSSLSERFRMSPFHLQRTFKAATGVTPFQYARALRVQRFKTGLRTDGSVTKAIYDAGFPSGSSVYQDADTLLGMTPGEYRRGGAGLKISYVGIETSLGQMLLGATDRGLCFLEFGQSEEEMLRSLRREFAAATLLPMMRPYPQEFEGWVRALSSYLEGEQELLNIPVVLRGTAFQVKVWNYLRTIPKGCVRSYSEVAEAVGHPQAVRAVGSACGANHIGLVIPCHRVIRGNGGLGGYRWGLDRKRQLLEAEREAPHPR